MKQLKHSSFACGISLMTILFALSLCGTSCSSKKDVAKDKRTVMIIEHKERKEKKNDKGDKKKGDNGKLYEEVEAWLGTPYKYGGQSKSGTDCSGLVVEIYKKVYGKKLYRSSYEIYEKNCKKIKKKELKEGDLVFFITSKNGKRINHVGIYLKDNKFIHSSTRRGVILTDLSDDYYEKHFVGAGRVISD